MAKNFNDPNIFFSSHNAKNGSHYSWELRDTTMNEFSAFPCIVFMFKSTNLNKCHYPARLTDKESEIPNTMFKGTQPEGVAPVYKLR